MKLPQIVKLDDYRVGEDKANAFTRGNLPGSRRAVNGKTAMTFVNAIAIRRALEAAGVELLDENGGGPGARFRKRVSD